MLLISLCAFILFRTLEKKKNPNVDYQIVYDLEKKILPKFFLSFVFLAKVSLIIFSLYFDTDISFSC